MDPSKYRVKSDWPFWGVIILIAAFYTLLIVGMLVADMQYAPPSSWISSLSKPEIQYATKLSLISCTVAALLSLLVAIPTAYLLARVKFPGARLLDAVLDIPIVLPPLVIGISLLIFFQTPIGQFIEKYLTFTYTVAGVILAQFTVACAFAVRTMRSTLDQLSFRPEAVALTLGCNRRQAFFYVGLPAAWRGVVTAFTLAWARSLGEFGPILVFAGATRFKTEVLPTTVFLELSVGELNTAVAVSLLMVGMAMLVLIVIRFLGETARPYDLR
jgi:molybdate transport system permease protein